MKIIVVGPFPPPVHGSSKNLLAITEELEAHVDVKRLNISPNSLDRGFGYHFVKFTRFVNSFFRIITSNFDRFYTTVDAGFGMLYSICLLFAARLRFADVIVHHRSFSYINKSSVLMRIYFFLSRKDTHVFLCECMRERFEVIYGVCESFLIVSNARQVNPLDKKALRSVGDKIILGYLSNISIEKGFSQVDKLFRKLINLGDYNLNVGGPVADNKSQSILDSLLSDFPDNVKYFGSVYGGDKEAFLGGVDVFVFPTDYSNEAQPNVLFEAMAAGCMVISTARGCISGDVISAIGRVFEYENYVDMACDFLSSLETSELNRYRVSALSYIDEQRSLSISGHSSLIRRLTV